MNTKDINKLFLAISATYPKEKAFVMDDSTRSRAMIQAWLRVLEDLSLDHVISALDAHAAKTPA